METLRAFVMRVKRYFGRDLGTEWDAWPHIQRRNLINRVLWGMTHLDYTHPSTPKDMDHLAARNWPDLMQVFINTDRIIGPRARHPQLRDQTSATPPPPEGDGLAAQPPTPGRGKTANRPAQPGPRKTLPHVRLNQVKAKLEQLERFVRQRGHQPPNQPPVGPRETVCQIGPASGNGPTPKRHGRGQHRQPRWQDAYDAREQEVGAYEVDIKGLKEAVVVMCRGITMLGDYAQHQVDMTPHFAPPSISTSSPKPRMSHRPRAALYPTSGRGRGASM